MNKHKKEATPEQKKEFEKKKAKQVAKGKPTFDFNTDEDTTGKSELFDKKEVGGHSKEKDD